MTTPKKTSLTTWVAVGLFSFIIYSCNSSISERRANTPPPKVLTAAEQQQVKEDDAAQDRATILTTLIRTEARDPKSVQFDSGSRNSNCVIIKYRARNGFGGISSAQGVINIKNGSYNVSAGGEAISKACGNSKKFIEVYVSIYN